MKKIVPPIPSALSKRREVTAAITKVSEVKNNHKGMELDNTNIEAVSNSIQAKLSSNDEIVKLFPDVEISIQTLVASILSPNDLINSRLTYALDNDIIPNPVNISIMDTIRSYVNRNYKLESKLSTILREALFTKGAYAEMIIPDTTVAAVASKFSNSELSAEEYINAMDKVGYLSDDTAITLSIEAMVGSDICVTDEKISNEDLGIEFLEDISAMLVPAAHITSLSTEAHQKINSNGSSLRSLMHKKRVLDGVISVDTDNSAGSPMCMKLPINSVIPIHMASDPSSHVGYFILLDETGLPVSGKAKISDNVFNTNEAKEANSVRSNIISKVSKALKGKTATDVKLTDINNIYTQALVATMKAKVTKGKFGNVVDVSENSDMYRAIFARALKGLKTRLLYVPIDNLSYFASEYRENGTGLSLLEKASMLLSIRATNMFTRIMANIKNSVTTTKVSATLDETDPDPDATKEIIINEAMKAERAKYPIGLINVNDLVDWMHNVGYRFDIKHPRLPDIQIDVSEDQRNIATPDESFDEMIQEHIIMSFGLKKDMVAAGFDAEFATTVVSNNALLAKRIMEHQNVFNPQLASHVRRIMLNDGLLKEKISGIIINNIKGIRKLINKSFSKDEISDFKEEIDDDILLTDIIYGEYVDGVTVTLPRVESSSEEGSLDGLEAYTSMLETYLPMLISSDTLPTELVGDLSDKMDDIMTSIKTVLIKNWVDERNLFPDLTKFFTLDNTGKPRYDILEEYSYFTESIAKAIIPHLKHLKKVSNTTDNKLEKIDSGEAEPAAAEPTPATDAGESDATGDQAPDDGTGDIPGL